MVLQKGKSHPPMKMSDHVLGNYCMGPKHSLFGSWASSVGMLKIAGNADWFFSNLTFLNFIAVIPTKLAC